MGEESGVKDVEEALKAAAAESSTAELESDEEASEEKVSAEGKSVPRDGSFVPRTRLNEALGRIKDLEMRLGEAAKTEEELGSLREAAVQFQTQAQEYGSLLERVRALAEHPREDIREAVVKIDNALKGIEEEIIEQMDEKEQAAKDSGDLDLQKKLQAQKEEVLDQLATDRAETLLELARDRASRYIAALPDTYTDAHKKVIGELWNNRVDWDAIESNPSSMNSELAKALQETLDLIPVDQAGTDVEDTTEAVLSPEDELKRILGKDLDWAKTDDKGNFVVNDDSFNKVAAHALRLSKTLQAT